jgi:hypothetical protein
MKVTTLVTTKEEKDEGVCVISNLKPFTYATAINRATAM